MAIDRTNYNALVDDDGSGTVGSIWNKNQIKNVLLDPIDAAFAPVTGNWAPSDASGAGLVIAAGGSGGTFVKIGPLVAFWIQIFFPGNVSAVAASIGGLPYVIRTNNAAGVQGYGILRTWLLVNGTQTMSPQNPTTGAAVTNQDLSGANMVLSGLYRTD